jgi:hypothetical protein
MSPTLLVNLSVLFASNLLDRRWYDEGWNEFEEDRKLYQERLELERALREGLRGD